MTKSYIEFKLIEEKPKTEVYGVYNKISKQLIGIIKWYPSWRKYCFFPERNTIFEIECLREIIKFIDNIMKKRK